MNPASLLNTGDLAGHQIELKVLKNTSIASEIAILKYANCNVSTMWDYKYVRIRVMLPCKLCHCTFN